MIAPLAPVVNGYQDLAYSCGISLGDSQKYWLDENVGPAKNPKASVAGLVGRLLLRMSHLIENGGPLDIEAFF